MLLKVKLLQSERQTFIFINTDISLPTILESDEMYCQRLSFLILISQCVCFTTRNNSTRRLRNVFSVWRPIQTKSEKLCTSFFRFGRYVQSRSLQCVFAFFICFVFIIWWRYLMTCAPIDLSVRRNQFLINNNGLCKQSCFTNHGISFHYRYYDIVLHTVIHTVKKTIHKYI